MKIQEVMSREVQIAAPSMPIGEAAMLMRDGDFGVLPVGEDDRLVGVITDRDIAVRAVAEGKDPMTRVADVMSEGVSWIYEDEDVDVAAKQMQERQIRRLPVVNRDKRLVGMISIGDFAVHEAEIRSAGEALSGVSEGAERHQRS